MGFGKMMTLLRIGCWILIILVFLVYMAVLGGWFILFLIIYDWIQLTYGKYKDK